MPSQQSLFEVQATDETFGDEFNRLAYESGWTDGLPVVPPTQARLMSFIHASGRPAEDIVGEIAPKRGAATVEKVAANAIMAGCQPEYMPVLLAVSEALNEPEFNLDGIQSTTNPAGVAVIVNGPVRHEIGMNWGRNCLGPGNKANATIGRAVRLILLNIGGGVPDIVDKAVHGYPGKYTFCFAENEEDNPWEPLHVEQGFRREDSTVTIVGAQGVLNNLTANQTTGRDMMRLVAQSLTYLGCNNVLLGAGQIVVLLTPGHVQLLGKEGFTKEATRQFLYDRTGVPETALPPTIRKERVDRMTVNGTIRAVKSPEDILLSVAGGPEPYHVAVMHTFGYTRAITKLVRRP